MKHHRFKRLGLSCLCLIALGCGGSEIPLVKVTGLITLNGEPLPEAHVQFRPVAGGRLSYGKTDADGRYQLEYLPGQRGAIIGTHLVSVSTFIEPDADSSDPDKQAGRKESIPAEFNSKTTLEVDVIPGSALSFDFELDSDNQLAQGDRK